MSYLPDAAGSGGVLAAAVAKLAASLKLDESKAVAAIGMEGGGVDAALAAAQGMLASGELAAAADVLGRAVRGTAAQHALANWLASVRARAAADQAMQLLQAHATSLASSVS